MSRTALQVQDELLALSPAGSVFSPDPDDYWAGLLLGWGSEAALIEQSMEALLPQIDPRVAFELLPDYERVLGPDPCGLDLATMAFADAAAIVYQRWTAGGEICAGYFVRLAAVLGVVATVTEVQAWVCGVATCDDQMVPEGENFAWQVTLPTDSLTNFECGVATCDDSLGTFAASLAECPITHQAPLHTSVYFSYTG